MVESYEIRLREHLSDRWTEHFTPLRMTLLDDGNTLLHGVIADQAQLFGLLQRIRDLNLTLLDVRRIQAPTVTHDEKGGNQVNPFLTIAKPQAWGPGSLEMAHGLVQATRISPGMRVLEVGGGSGQIAATIAKHWDTQVVTLEPWTDGAAILAYAASEGVANRVLPLRIVAQSLPFPADSFDAIISIGSFEMIGDERPQALREMIRVARPGSRIGIAEPMCLPVEMPADLRALDEEHRLTFRESFRTLAWNRQLFEDQGLSVVDEYYFPEAHAWWSAYAASGHISEGEKDFIRRDQGRWLSLGLMVGEKG